MPGEAGDGGIREPDLDITDAKEQRDNLQRRMDMERSSIQHASPYYENEDASSDFIVIRS